MKNTSYLNKKIKLWQLGIQKCYLIVFKNIYKRQKSKLVGIYLQKCSPMLSIHYFQRGQYRSTYFDKVNLMVQRKAKKVNCNLCTLEVPLPIHVYKSGCEQDRHDHCLCRNNSRNATESLHDTRNKNKKCVECMAIFSWNDRIPQFNEFYIRLER